MIGKWNCPIWIIGYFIAVAFYDNALAVELAVSGHAGVTSNPHQLSDSFQPDSEVFTLFDLKFSNRFDNGSYFKAQTKQSLFLNDETADRSRTKLDLGYRSKFHISEQKFRYKLWADSTIRNSTYVSKTTGQVATFNGQSIADRYDSVQNNLNAYVSLRSANKTRYKISYQHRDKDYQDYSIPGLSNFDYAHHRLRLNVDFRVSDESHVVAKIGTTRRDFKDRRAQDLNGDDIPGTNLEYDYLEYSLGYSYRPDKTVRLGALVEFIEREDNGVGYADSTYDRVTLSARFVLSETDSLDASLRYSDLAYVNQVVIDPSSLEEFGYDNKGYSILVDYRRALSSREENKFTLLLNFEAFDFDSSDPRYQYSEYVFSAGVRYDVF